jgi:serine O-acetyltransferase
MMPSVAAPFREDVLGYYRREYGTETPTLFQRARVWVTGFEFHCVAIYRFGQYADKVALRHRVAGRILRTLHRLLNLCSRFFHQVQIESSTEIGPGFYIAHVGGILIGARSIGRNFTVMHNVTIGIGESHGKSGVPVIGNDVWIGTCSVVSGAITVGNGVTVANGSILTRSVPDGCLVAGNPARVVLTSYDNRKLFERHVPEESASASSDEAHNGAGNAG